MASKIVGYVSQVAYLDGALFTVERDPSIPLGDFMTELMTPTPCSRVFATDTAGRKEVALDTLLAGDVFLAADHRGLVVADKGRVHLRDRDGTWRVVNDVRWSGGGPTTAHANMAVTAGSVVFASSHKSKTFVHVVDRATGVLERAPDLPAACAIAILGRSIAFASGNLEAHLGTRDLFEDEEPTLVALPSRAIHLTTIDEVLVAAIDGGLAIVRGDDVEVQHPKHRFDQAWVRREGPWYALLAAYSAIEHEVVERAGMCLCRLRDGAVEPIWAETPPPLGESFHSTVLKSVAFGDGRIYLAHEGEVVTIDPDGPIVERVHVT